VRTVFLRDCATCHGSDGTGTTRGPTIAAAGAALVDYELTTGRMPMADPDDVVRRSHPRYPPDVIAGLVGYVDGLGSGTGEPVPSVAIASADLARGGELYRLNCAACHSWSGTGGALLGREAPGLSRSTPVQVVEALRTGPGAMPSFGRESFSTKDAVAVAAYVRELQHPEDRGGEALLHLGPLPEGAVAWIAALGVLIIFTVWAGDREGKHK
jgi:ubiquinol-cytochrome c reductase cytochrome c subunit